MICRSVPVRAVKTRRQFVPEIVSLQLLDGCSNVQVFDETVRLARSLGPLPLILILDGWFPLCRCSLGPSVMQGAGLSSFDSGEQNESEHLCLSRDNIKALIMDMFAAGTETTSLALEWAMAELIRNPKVMENIQEDVRRVVGCNQKISDRDIDKMVYLKAVIKETLRLHAPAPLLAPREAMNDTKLDGFHIPRGTRVMVNAWAIGRDPSSWDKPEEFCPERFIGSNVDFKGQDFHFIPFGAGRRSCPGANFAISTVELTLAHLLHHFDWQLPKGMEGEVLDMSEAPGIAVHKKSGLVLIAKPVLFN